jgi:hypothetical protein
MRRHSSTYNDNTTQLLSADEMEEKAKFINGKTMSPEDCLFTLRHHFFSYGDYTITDDNGKVAFQVHGKFPNSWTMKDNSGKELYHIKKR